MPLRPTVVFGREDILLNNIARLLRRFPVFAVAGDGVGPETYTFVELVELLRDAVGSRARLLHTPPWMVAALSRVLSVLVRDVLLTRDELRGMMADLVTVDGPATTPTSLRESHTHLEMLGAYASELARYYVVREVHPIWGIGQPAKEDGMEFLLWLIAVILVVSGIVYLLRGVVAWGLLLVIVGLLVGPGGVSLFA